MLDFFFIRTSDAVNSVQPFSCPTGNDFEKITTPFQASLEVW